MQRVLSFQMARGFGESSEFVTKRMCFSFLFSVGFLCLLCGFLLGRFAAQRAVEFRAEKKRLELSGNGLESTEYLQHLLFQELERDTLDIDFPTNSMQSRTIQDEIQKTNVILSNFSLVQQVVRYNSSITAIVRGSREPDRYVVLSASGEGAGITIGLVRVLNKIQEEHGWKPRRSIVFCLFFASSDPCAETFPDFHERRIIAYIALYDANLQGNGPLVTSGSDVIQSEILQSVNALQKYNSRDNPFVPVSNWTNDNAPARLTMDLSHAVFSFAKDNMNIENENSRRTRKTVLAQILGHGIWRLCESLVLKWDVNYFNETVNKTLEPVSNPAYSKMKEKMQDTLFRLTTNIEKFNKMVGDTECTKILDMRMFNDLSMDLDRALLCPDRNVQSRTDLAVLAKVSRAPPNVVFAHLDKMIKCYKAAIEILNRW